MADIKFDKRNYRKHNDKNKQLIKKSLEDCGTGRSILIDNEGEIIAGNGVYAEASKLNIPVKIIETDGNELIAIKRTDLATDDEKRKQLAVMDNTTSDSSSFDMELLNADFEIAELQDLGVSTIKIDYSGLENNVTMPTSFAQPVNPIPPEALPEELREQIASGQPLTPDVLEKVENSYPTATERIIITYRPEEKEEMQELLGFEFDKIVYNAKEIRERVQG